MGGESDDGDSNHLYHETKNGQGLFAPAGSEVDPPHCPDHDGRETREDDVLQEDALDFLSLELEVPRENAGNEHGESRKRSPNEVVVGRVCQAATLRPLRDQIECDRGKEERDGKVDENDMLRVLCKEYGLNVEGMHGGPAFVKSSRQ